MLFDDVFENLFKSLYNEFLQKVAKTDDFKEIMLFCFKSSFNLIINNKIRPLDLLQKNFKVLKEISDSKNKSILDCLTLNLNDDINEMIKTNENNPWIDNIWEEIIEYLSYLFKNNFPRELVENDIWKYMEDKKEPISFEGCNFSIFENHKFTAYKCRFTLNLMKLMQRILKSTFLPQKSVKELFTLIDMSADLSLNFNNQSLNRFLLWKKGYFSDINFLPSLHIFEINVLLAKFLYYKKNLSKDNTKIFDFCILIFKNYLEKIDTLEDAFRSYVTDDKLFMEEEELNMYFKIKNFEEKQMAIEFIYNLINDHVNVFLKDCELEQYGNLPIFNELIEAIIDYLPKAEIKNYLKFAPVSLLKIDNSGNNLNKLKPNIDIGGVLKKLIKVTRNK